MNLNKIPQNSQTPGRQSGTEAVFPLSQLAWYYEGFVSKQANKLLIDLETDFCFYALHLGATEPTRHSCSDSARQNPI